LKYRLWADAYEAVFIEIHGDRKPPQRRYILGPALEDFYQLFIGCTTFGVGRIGMGQLRWFDVN
jgi:hypothetical protein